MSHMFEEYHLSTLNISSFDTSNVTNMSYMFSTPFLSTIYVGDDWSVAGLTATDSDNGMFENCYDLVGGNGTSFDNTTDKSYARIDTASTPGYFTAI